jgi:Tol biopolymer transport system component
VAIEPGQTLLHYRIVEKIGSGGMGEVWSAEDTKLRRMVALKTLPRWTAADDYVRARFEREAQAIAALNHPNIVTVHSVEEADGMPFLTMELIDGESLAGELKQALPIERLFSLAIPLADAVGAAHDQGILHRDLKPDNVMLTKKGTVKVLDFGLAKLRGETTEEAAESDPTGSLTRDGKIAGTAAYMSPEQAEGLALGPPSDVFALGILLYQMACGKRPFSGKTSISMISSILKDEPPRVTAINRDLPLHLGRIVRRCLDKNPARRYPTAGELRNELDLLREEIAGSDGEPEVLAASRPYRKRLMATAAALALMTLVAVAGWMRSTGDGVAALGVTVSQQTFHGGVETNPTLSPDGQLLAYEALSADGDSDVFLERVDGRNPINLTDESNVFDGAPAFSPDGTRIAFRSDRGGGGIYVMGATGESVRRITDFGSDPAWSPDGTQLVFATERVDSPLRRSLLSELWVADVATGETRIIYAGDAVQPSWSPNGQRIAFWTAHVGETGSGQRDLGTVRSDGSDPVVFDDDPSLDWRPVWSPDGRALYFASDRGGSMNLWRIVIDEESGLTRGDARPITTPAVWSGPFSISADGKRIAYTVLDESARLVGIPFDPVEGELTGEAVRITRGALQVHTWDASPDGEWVAFSNAGRQEDLYLVRRDGGGLRKVTDDLDKDRGVSWLDDERLIFYSGRGGGYEVWTVRKDGSELRQITESTGHALWMPRVSADGARLLAHNAEGSYVFDFGTDPPLRKEQALHISGVEGTEGRFQGNHWSPDGEQILGTVQEALTTCVALHDMRDGSFRLFRAPTGEDSLSGGWLPDGRRFLATAGGSAWVVDAQTASWRELPLRIGEGTAKLTPDGRTLQYIDTITEADIWLARIE